MSRAGISDIYRRLHAVELLKELYRLYESFLFIHYLYVTDLPENAQSEWNIQATKDGNVLIRQHFRQGRMVIAHENMEIVSMCNHSRGT